VDQFYGDADPMLEKLRGLKEYYLITPAQDYDELRPWLPGASCVLERRRLFDVKLRNVLAREPLPELLLVTNRCQ
jgi:hypothetical protein